MAKKLTPWFPADVKPARKGLYVRDFDSGPRADPLLDLQYWDGEKWHYGPTKPTPFQRHHYVDPFPRRWRGLAQQPKGAAK